MRILNVLTYYRPHTSGLTIYVERLARALVRRGHEVTVLTSQYEKSLPGREMQDGVQIVRAPVAARISKGVLMPTIGFLATRLVRAADIIHLHLPQFDAAGVALRGRLFHKPTVITYHCDLILPPGPVNRLANGVVKIMNHLAGRWTDRIVTYTQDFADHSPYLRRFAPKLRVIPPPVELPNATPEAAGEFARRHNPDNRRPVIAMATRFASEKGIEVLLGALPKVLKEFPNALVLFAGQYQDVLGEREYFQRLIPAIRDHESRNEWRFLGVLDQPAMAAFYPNIEILTVPSLNSTESFGLVQIEAMMNGVPVVASDLPGVRQPVRMTGMGQIVPPGDSDRLADALIATIRQGTDFKAQAGPVRQRFHTDAAAETYEKLFHELLCGT